uniref:Prominin, isoform D n=2 Tax=Drosophila melanogaster TaxID=7227 RepID=B7YZQ3_DROME|nr:prominin, isoform D [Drosophila melanogaster]ACL83207.1 prominin, isoform D [Drosophila melanogaster]|eukprot:NP_001137754.1 prominin, isoform D [Drosophila melanogaster]
MDQRNLTLPTPAATTIMSSSSAAMSAGFASLGGPTTSALTGSTIALATTTTTAPPTTTPATFFTYSIPGMDIAPGPFIFTYVSEFLSLITPEELPLDSIRDVLHKNTSLLDFASNAIKIESGFIALMSVFAILALVPLIATCAWCCGRRSTQEEVDHIRNAPCHIRDESLEESLRCRKSAGLVTLWVVFILLTLSDFSIFYANSRLSAGIEMTPEMVKSAVHDVEVFLKDTHLQIKQKLDNGFHVSVERVVKDLEDVDVLLGEPIQAEISAHTGLELAYDSLTTLSLANAELIYRVLMLQETVGRALKLSQEAAARMEELQIQLSVLQRQCTYRDRPLCDTLRIRSFEENGVVDALKTLQEDQSIFRMRYLGEIEFGATVKNLTSEVGVSRSIFSNFPQQVKHDTAYERNYTLEQLASIRHRTTANAQQLTSTVNGLLRRLEDTWSSLQPAYNELKEWADAYWSVGWIAGTVIVWVMLFMLMSYCCFLCESNAKSGVVFFIAVMLICLASICLTIFGVFSLAVGGNAEVFVCRSLYDEDYNMLGKLLDKPGYAYAREPQTGIIGELLRPVGVNRSVVNVGLGQALRGCEQNQASYNVFQLDAFVNTSKIADLRQFPKVSTAIDAISVSGRTLLSLTQSVQNILDNMLQTSSFNLTTYRSSVGAPTPEKDLATFIDQMQRVALQIQDVATSSRMTTLGSRSKRLQASILQPLENLQNEILYHLTALELQRDPWAKQVNQTLNHLKSIQSYLENKAGEICHNMTRDYRDRLKAYLTTSKATMESQLGDTTTKCRPFYDTFDASRTFLCRNMVDFINGLTFFIFLTLLLWAIGTPVGLNLITVQTRLNVMQAAQARSKGRHRRSDRSPEHEQRSGSRGRKKQRTSSSATSGRSGKRDQSRERSTSSTARPKPPLRRTATEETLDLADEESTPSRQQQQQPPPQRRQESDRERVRERDQRSRERELSRGRDASAMNTPVRSRSRQQLRHDPEDDNWGSSSGPSRANSRERDRESSQTRKILNIWQSRNKAKTPLRRQGTEEFDFEDAHDDRGWQAQTQNQVQNQSRAHNQSSVSPEQRPDPRSHRSNLRTKPKLRSTNADRASSEAIRRPITPVLSVNSDIPAAIPMPRTPMRLKSKVSLTARAVQDIVNKRNQRLQRTGTDEFDLDDSDAYGAGGHLDADVAAARRTPPRGAPPPPPPPAAGLNSDRTVRWNEDETEDFDFEEVDAPKSPMYLSHNLQ